MDGRERPKARGQASIQDVLGGAGDKRPVRRKWLEHLRNLTRLRERLAEEMRRRSQLARLPLTTSDEHMADGASDSYDRDWALAMASSDQDALYEIDQALNRMANGTYGTCELTGRPIEAARLRTIPWTRFCARAQAELEVRGVTPRAHLGVLGTYASTGDTERAEEDEIGETPPAERQAA